MDRLSLTWSAGDMDDTTTRTLTLTAAVGAGLCAGVYFAFSTFIMRALGRLPAPDGLRAMQSINRFAPNPPFMVALFGTGLLCLGLAVGSVATLDQSPSRLRLAGALLYLVSVGLTVAFHVPRNDAVDALDPTAPSSADAWRTYCTEWTAGNHVRTVAALAGTIALVLSART